MLRRTPLVRLSTLRQKTPVRRFAKSREGLSRAMRLELDGMARAVVMIRAGAYLMPTDAGRGWYGKCQWCQLLRWLQWCHVYPQGKYRALIWETDNALAMCWGCHNAWHKVADLDKMKRVVIDVIGDDAWHRLQLRARQRDVGKRDYELIRIELLAQLQSMGVSWPL